MTTFRSTVTIDWDDNDPSTNLDPDEFHDQLRDHLETTLKDMRFNCDESKEVVFTAETVRDINIEELDD